ncbi:hypothetical protein QL285_022745 [Trifolium repens]|nr:hypothetical protein QL285_022745 [Trifolium repens]
MHKKKIDAVSLSIEILDENEPSLPEKLNNPANHSKPKEVEVVSEQDTSVEIDKSKDEKKEIDEQDDSHKDDVDEGGDKIEKKQWVSFVKLPTKSHEKPYTPSWSEKKLDGIVKEIINTKLEATWQKKKVDSDKHIRYKYMVAILNSMNIYNTFNVADCHSHGYQTFNQDKNSGSSSLEVEEKVKTHLHGRQIVLHRLLYSDKDISLLQ